jgi:tRNA-2-methylthio-N6-dimethylallyladenosine synthase
MAGKTVYLETFGCQMNELDSELVTTDLSRLGYVFSTDAQQADVVLYNTCSVREQAEQKVWSRIGELAKRKLLQPDLIVGVLGCMAERDGTALLDRMPAVDLLCGPAELDKLPALLDNAVRTKLSMIADERGAGAGGTGRLVSARQVALQGDASRRSGTLAAAGDRLEMLDLSRAVSPLETNDRRSAYVRITRGCNKFCTYCVVPHTRGAEVHRPPAHIIDECKRLVDAGVIEITLLGQTVNHYRFEHDAAVTLEGVVQPQKGRTYKGAHRRDAFSGERVTTFADLLHQIHEQVPDLQRLRFVTSYPKDFGDDVLEVMRDCPRICRYLHVPAQSGSDRMLKLMNRGYTVAEYDEFVDRARHYLDQPEIGRPLMISGDIIVGFPTETDEDFAKTVELLERSRYKSCFIFKYSPRPGTTAYDRIPDDVPESVKRARNNELLAVQTRISDQISQEQVGRSFRIMVEGLSKKTLQAGGLSHGQIRKAGAVALTIGGAAHEGEPVAHSASSSSTGTETVSAVVQYSGRTEGDQIVFFDAPADQLDRLTGTIVDVQIDSADRLSLLGRLAHSS